MEYFSACPFLSVSGSVVTEIVNSFLHGSPVLNGTGAENTLWNRIECNIRKYYCSEPSEAQGNCASSLKHDWAFPSLLPFLTCSSMWWSNSWWSGSSSPRRGVQHKARFWSLLPAGATLLLPLPAMGDGPTQFSSWCFGGKMVMVARVKPCWRTAFNVTEPLLIENGSGESAVATSRAARSVKWFIGRGVVMHSSPSLELCENMS